MKIVMRSISVVALAFSLISPTFSKAEEAFGENENTHGVFVMTNASDKNEVISYRRESDGSLHKSHRFWTGGRGSGGNTDPLESQSSLTLSQDRSLLFAVNAGSGDISVFRVRGSLLWLEQLISSGGSEPNAIAQHGDLVYVLNAGGSSDVVGFRLRSRHLVPIQDSVRFLSTNTSGAASLAFSPDGQFLLVTERLTNSIDVFRVGHDGTLSTAKLNPSAGPGLFSVTFASNGAALTTETGTSEPNSSAVSSYAVMADGTLHAISISLPTLGAANCWNVVTPSGGFVYNSNAGSANIAGFAVGKDGSLTALSGTIVGTNPAGATNLDIAVSSDGKFLYTLNSGNGTVGIFIIQSDGSLNNIGSTDGLPASAGLNGIAAN